MHLENCLHLMLSNFTALLFVKLILSHSYNRFHMLSGEIPRICTILPGTSLFPSFIELEKRPQCANHEEYICRSEFHEPFCSLFRFIHTEICCECIASCLLSVSQFKLMKHRSSKITPFYAKLHHPSHLAK